MAGVTGLRLLSARPLRISAILVTRCSDTSAGPARPTDSSTAHCHIATVRGKQCLTLFLNACVFNVNNHVMKAVSSDFKEPMIDVIFYAILDSFNIVLCLLCSHQLRQSWRARQWRQEWWRLHIHKASVLYMQHRLSFVGIAGPHLFGQRTMVWWSSCLHM